jgi:phage-related protein
MPKINLKDTTNYVSISPDGDFRLPAKEGEEGAVLRAYELKDGTKGEKWEILANSIAGKITGINFVTTEYGRLLQITLDDDLAISVSTTSNFATDLMKKLPALDLSKTYLFSPFAFENEKGKTVKGVTIIEGEEYNKEAPKVKNYFSDGEKSINDFPEPKGDTTKYTKNKWKSYFGEVEDFLVEYTEKNVAPKLVATDF